MSQLSISMLSSGWPSFPSFGLHSGFFLFHSLASDFLHSFWEVFAPPFSRILMVTTWLEVASWNGIVYVGYISRFPAVILNKCSGMLVIRFIISNSFSVVISYSSWLTIVLFNPLMITWSYYCYLFPLALPRFFYLYRAIVSCHVLSRQEVLH